MKKIASIIIFLFVIIATYAMTPISIDTQISNITRARHTAQQGVSSKQLKNLHSLNESATTQDTIELNFSGFTKFGYDSKYKDWYMDME